MTSTEQTNPPSEEYSPIDFRAFILSLTSSAMYHLGEIPDPDSGEPQVNLGIAKQTIDIIAMLKEKTHGNLNEEEQKTVDALLSELQIRYVEASK